MCGKSADGGKLPAADTSGSAACGVTKAAADAGVLAACGVLLPAANAGLLAACGASEPAADTGAQAACGVLCTPADTGRLITDCVKLSCDQALLIRRGVKAIPRKVREIVLDFDAADDPLHGAQEGAFFHGFYRQYCYLPLYCFCGNIPLYAKLRDCKRDASEGTVEALKKIVPASRRKILSSDARCISRLELKLT